MERRKKTMKVAISIDKLALSTRSKFDICYPFSEIPNFKFANYVVKNGKPGKEYKKEKKKERNIIKYLTVMKFKHVETGNILIISNQRKSKYWAASPVYIIFYPGVFHPITYPDVFSVQQFFLRECGIRLQVSVVHPAVDLVWKTSRKRRYKKILRHLKPGSKKPYRPPNEKLYKNGNYFGKPSSSNQLFIYDKRRQLLKEKGIKVPGDMVRIESRFHVPQMKNFPNTIDGLAEMDWSFIYPKYFSFHDLTTDFMLKVNFACESWRRPIWKLKNIAKKKLGISSSNFYRSCLVDHRRLSDPVRRALAAFRWCANFRQFQS
jgi:hypothetical protein